MADQPNLGSDKNGRQIPLPTPSGSLKTNLNSSISTSTAIPFVTGARLLIISALAQPVCFSWGSRTVVASTDNFDFIIPAGSTIARSIATQTTTGVFYTTCAVIEQTAGATVIIEQLP